MFVKNWAIGLSWMKPLKEILGKTSSFNHLDNMRKISALLHSSYKI
jgi:hypothetical protein